MSGGTLPQPSACYATRKMVKTKNLVFYSQSARIINRILDSRPGLSKLQENFHPNSLDFLATDMNLIMLVDGYDWSNVNCLYPLIRGGGVLKYIGVHMYEQKKCVKRSPFCRRKKQGMRLWVYNAIFQKNGGGQNLVKFLTQTYRIVSNKRPGGVAIFQKGDVYKRQIFNAKMQWLSLFTMTRRKEI